MVQLEPSGVALFKELDGSFNSIMVQLEHFSKRRCNRAFVLSIPLWFN